MSNDLISRKETIETVREIIRAGLSEETIYAELEEIPTAYDVDAVCEEIKRVPHGYLNCETEGEILEIVRNGGKKA